MLAYSTSDTYQEQQRMAALIEMYWAKHIGRQVDNKAILLPPPSREDVKGEFYLGKTFFGDKPMQDIFLSREQLIRHSGFFGASRSGKTNAAQSLILQLLEKDVKVFVIDFKKTFKKITTLDDDNVKKLKVYSVGRKSNLSLNLNFLRPPPGVHVKTWASKIANILERSHTGGPGTTDAFLEIFDRLFLEAGFYETENYDELEYPNFFDAKEMHKRLKVNKGRKGTWYETVDRILNSFIFTPEAAESFNARKPVKLEELFNDNVILELGLDLPDELGSY